jgi:xylan 1,4-beta-xylosidase
MEAYREVEGRPVHNFERIGAVYDAILGLGMKPFVEISFMPTDLASRSETIFYWGANGAPPKDYGKWADFIAAYARFLVDRYGRDEIRTWRFEIWNEPNLNDFWRGDQAEYFRLYSVTTRALRAVEPALQVGGPASAGAAWIPEMIDYAQSSGAPLDFVSTHTYGVDGGFFDETGADDNMLSRNPEIVVQDVYRVRQQVEASARAGLPVHFTEWSASYNPRDPVHDAYISAPFILDKLKRAEGYVQSMSYWAYTDLFEEAGPPPAPFHGGFGLVSREGVRKPSFFAYKYLNSLGSTELAHDDPRAWLTREGDAFSALIWDFTLPQQDVSNRPYFRRLHPADHAQNVELALNSLTPGRYTLTLRRTGFQENDAYSQYIAWGLPQSLSADQIATLHELTNDAPESERVVRVGADGAFTHTLQLRTNDIVLISLRPAR